MMGVRREARAALDAAGVRPRKRWGQHFLCDGGVVRRIVETARVGPESVVLEIGPGLGALTDALAARAGRLYLVEVDPVLAARLGERYAGAPHVRVVQADVLAAPLGSLVPDEGVTVVGNLPYNIATEVVFRLLESRARFPRAVLMVQREVAARLAARPDTAQWGVVSVLVQTFAVVRIAFGVSPRSFLPPPKVQSAVVEITWSVAPRVPVDDVAAHRAVVRAAFGQRRKMLRNALGVLAPVAQVEAACSDAGIDPRARAETLDLDAFARLARSLRA
ncbi:MAG: 16S rRNA (adenine(1518)-N(6)/adenine(1519)-N(6))-dimethyltransferase RsmA [Candidatus Binatia bacterium]